MTGILLAAFLLSVAGAEAASVKSVQTGTLTMTSAVRTASLGTAVDSTKAFIVCSSRTDSSNASNRATCELSDTTVTVTTGAANGNQVVRWYVVEFDGGASVQRGVSSFGTGTGTVDQPIASVTLSKAFHLLSERTTSTSQIIDEEWTIRGQLNTATNLRLTRNETGIAVDVAWQVIQMEDASVQRGLNSIADGSTTATPAIASVDTATSFLVFSRRAPSTAAGIEPNYQVRGQITSPTQLTFTRIGTTGSTNISWEVVSLSDGSSVQRGTSSTAAVTDAILNAALASVDLTASIPWVSASGGAGTNTADLDQTSWTATLSSATNLELQRTGSFDVNSQVAWQVISFFRCGGVANVAYAAATAGDGQAIVQWESATPVLVLRKTSAFGTEAPVNGTTYSVGATIGAATVVYNGSIVETSFTDTPLANGTTFFYRVVAKSTAGSATPCYATGAGTDVTALPQAASTQVAWSYVLAGGAALRSGTAGFSQLFVGSNASRVIGLDTGTGLQSWHPAASGAPVQGWVSWVPDASVAGTVYVGTQGGAVQAVDAATGAVNWSTALPGTDAVQASISIQLRAFADATWQAAYPGAFDVVFAATRNASSTDNKVFALRSDTGAVLWTFDPQATLGLAMDIVNGQPWVDYTRNRLYFGSRAGAGGSQRSIWVISALDGSHVVSGALGDIDMSPSVSFDETTLYFATTTGNLFAGDLDALGLKWTGAVALGTAIVGYLWEDYSTPGRLYFSTADGNVRCLEDPGPGPAPSPATPCSGWATPTTAVPGPATPILLDALYVGSTDGRIHVVDAATGAAVQQYVVGDGTRPVGDASTEDGGQIFVGTTEGKMFKINLPLP